MNNWRQNMELGVTADYVLEQIQFVGQVGKVEVAYL